MSDSNRYGTCSDKNGHWGIEDDNNIIVSGLVSHDACDAVMDLLDERDEEIARLNAEVERLTKAGDVMKDRLCWCYLDGVRLNQQIEDAWNAAKEGKDGR